MIGSFRLLKHVKHVKCVNKTHRLFSSKAIFKDVPQGPPDAILGLTTAWRNDPNTEKLNLGVGAYRDDNGKPFVLDCVRKAEKALLDQNLDMEYAGIDGVPTFRKVASELAYGKDSKALETLTCSQTLSGTGALRLAGEFLNRFGKGRSIYLPTPTWGNHIPIFRDSGLEVKQYRYYDAKTCGLDFDGMLQDIQAAPKGQIFLFHACAHNPTGVDPTPEQWREISNVVKAADQFVVVDMAYQGFASGDPERDATALQTFVGDQHNLMLCQSFAKNFGLYGQRTGMLSYVANDTDERDRVESQFKILIRPMYSNPPIHGARIVSHILSDKQLSAQWRDEVRLMADRIHGMRAALRSALEAHGSTRDWSHIEQQIGMFCYSGLSQAHVEQLKADYSVYLTSDGRISMAGVTSHNVERLAYCIHQVTK